MHIDITSTNIRELADRLQKSLGTDPSDAIKRSKAYEAIAALLGQPNWDTLNGVLKREPGESMRVPVASVTTCPWNPRAGVTLVNPITLYAAATSESEYVASDWVKLTIDQTFINRLIALQSHVGQNTALLRDVGPDEEVFNISAACNTPIEWDEPTKGDYLNIHGEELIVGSQAFWLKGVPKHASYAMLMRAIHISTLLQVLRARANSASFAWVGDNKLLHVPSEDFRGFAEDLLADGQLTEDEADLV